MSWSPVGAMQTLLGEDSLQSVVNVPMCFKCSLSVTASSCDIWLHAVAVAVLVSYATMCYGCVSQLSSGVRVV